MKGFAMRFALVFLACVLLAPIASAAQFSSILEALSTRLDSDDGDPRWEYVQDIKGVKWKWPIYKYREHYNAMVGTTKVGKSKDPNIGRTTVTLNGRANAVVYAWIEISNASAGLESLGAGVVRKIRTTCDEESDKQGYAFYVLERREYEPLYVSISHGSEANGNKYELIILSIDDFAPLNPLIAPRGCDVISWD